MSVMERTQAAIIGAGISGLAAGQRLRRAGIEVRVFDKSRGVGGRMATRRFAGGRFDHGAQFFTVRHSRFQSAVEKWLEAGTASFWADGFADTRGAHSGAGHPRYRGANGMTAVPKAMAAGLNIELNSRVTSVRYAPEGWLLEFEAGRLFAAESLVLTAPVPQSLAFLSEGGVLLPDHQARLEQIEYAPCIAVMALLDRPSLIPAPGGLQVQHGPLRWIGDNSQKGISPDKFAVTLHASAAFSRQHYDTPADAVAELLLEAARIWLGAAVVDYQVHRWRYSQVLRGYSGPEPFLDAGMEVPLVFAGDAFGGPNVEGAWLSGDSAGSYLAEKFQ